MSSPSAAPVMHFGNAFNTTSNEAQNNRGITLESFLACFTVSASVFAVEIVGFLLLRNRLRQIYQPHAKLVPRGLTMMTTPGIFGWIRPTLSTPDTVFLERCGLDAYFFLRFLQTLLKMFIPLAFVVLPILLTLNLACGNSGISKVRGLDKLSWANFGMTHSNYYWAYLILALSTIVHFCYTIYQEFCEYVRIRQEYLVSSPHCHQISATTIFLAGIPNNLLSFERLSDLYKDLFDGVQDVWINQDCSRLLSKVKQRDKIVALLETAETKLIAKAVKAHGKLCHNASGPEKSPPTRLYSESSVPVWKQYLQDEDRACVRLPICGLAWVPGLPFIGRKVDVIEHCRQQLARLNTEIETEQLDPKKHPLLNSAFIRFHSQKAAHLACRATAYCSPHKIVPQFVDVSPEDVIWESLLVRWWGDYARRYLIIVFIVVLIMGWSIPIAFTGLLSQISYLVPLFPWLHGLERMPKWLLGFVQGLLPQAILMVLTMLLPITVRLLAEQQGFSAGMFIELAVQRYYFSLLFLQVFLTVSLSSSATTILGDIFDRPGSIPSMLATNIPKTSNYFYSYMLLQAFSISANALIQVARLMEWVFLTSLMDRTPRQKWRRKANVPEMQWGTIYPVYTNLACIGIVYSVIAPLIIVFSIITFTLFWIVFRYNLLYVMISHHDTRGRLYPIALNQLFTGIYIMEMCLLGLFLLVRDEHQRSSCKFQAAVMIIVTGVTVTFQILLNRAFAPLLQFLSLVSADQCRESGDVVTTTHLEEPEHDEKTNEHYHAHTEHRMYCEGTFQNEALRVKRPVVWIPKDTIGISDSELYQTKMSYPDISISNENASMKSNGDLEVGRNSPDF